ncbi:DNA helicase I, partial [Salmonella enterica]|nr:DNA helicase I [Salmonella enterica]
MSYININEIDSFIEVMGWTMDSNTQGFTSYWRNSLADAEFGKGAFERKDEDSFNDLTANLYKLWNRMASGSYFPPPVRRVEIPKSGGDPGPKVSGCSPKRWAL